MVEIEKAEDLPRLRNSELFCLKEMNSAHDSSFYSPSPCFPQPPTRTGRDMDPSSSSKPPQEKSGSDLRLSTWCGMNSCCSMCTGMRLGTRFVIIQSLLFGGVSSLLTLSFPTGLNNNSCPKALVQ